MSPDPLVEDERYRLMIDRLPAAVFVHGHDGQILFANRAAARLAGVGSANELVRQSIGDLLPPPFLKSVRRGLLSGDVVPERVRERLTRADGEVIDVEVSEIPYVSGGILCVQLSVSDVRAAIGAERAIAVAERRMRELAEQIPGVLWTADLDGRITSCTGRLGFADDRASWEGAPFDELFGGRADEARSAHQVAVRGNSASCEVARAGRVLSVHLEPLYGEDRAIEGSVGLATDITSFKRLEGLRRQSERLDALARLAGGVAHQVNNVLGAILARATALELEHQALRPDLVAIMEAARRGSVVTANLLGFARGGMYRRETLSVEGLVLDRAITTRRKAHGQVEVTFDTEVEGRWIEGDPVQLRAAVDAVCDNALDATPAGGEVALRARSEDLARADLPDPDLPAGRYAVIEVRDTGTGLSREVLDRAFEPYYTTHAGDGRGLGLSMVYGVLRHHGGFVRLENVPEGGARASLYLPEHEVVAVAAPAVVARPATEAERGTVLVVDDDELMRFATSRLLERLGYDVVEANGGASALALFAARAAPFEFVLLDLRMPGMAGDEVLRRLLAIDSDVRVVLCTGYDRDGVIQGLLRLGRVGFLQKPFTFAALVQQIQFVRPESAVRSPRRG